MNIRPISPARCNECRAQFEDDEDMYMWDGGFVCSDCFDVLFDELSRGEKAALIGSAVTKNRRPDRTPVSG